MQPSLPLNRASHTDRRLPAIHSVLDRANMRARRGLTSYNPYNTSYYSRVVFTPIPEEPPIATNRKPVPHHPIVEERIPPTPALIPADEQSGALSDSISSLELNDPDDPPLDLLIERARLGDAKSRRQQQANSRNSKPSTVSARKIVTTISIDICSIGHVDSSQTFLADVASDTLG
jgi:hypothetical protein